MFRETLFPYLLLVGLPLVVLAIVLEAGAGLTASGIVQTHMGAGNSAPAPMSLFLLVLQVTVVLLASRLVGMLFRRMKQPQVVGEMVAGILLGPSLLGWVAPQFSAFLFPASSLGYLNALSQIG